MRGEPLHKVEGFPWWMNTLWGRWLCSYWRPAATLWRTLMAVHFHETAKAELERCTAELQRAANACVVRDFSDDARSELTRAWCAWRNARDDEHRQAESVVGRKLWREKLRLVLVGAVIGALLWCWVEIGIRLEHRCGKGSSRS